ncbi:MAG: hypothetical protein H6948_16245 [Zoogloeaceae bacterium]|nr:hypothetical protein [Zoogloeaceae bacterium]
MNASDAFVPEAGLMCVPENPQERRRGGEEAPDDFPADSLGDLAGFAVTERGGIDLRCMPQCREVRILKVFEGVSLDLDGDGVSGRRRAGIRDFGVGFMAGSVLVTEPLSIKRFLCQSINR